MKNNSEQMNLFKDEKTPVIKPSGPVTCLGIEFKNDAARREHFTNLLREKLKDPEFRNIEGFPHGEDEDILALSDPPYYTACPNPWIEDFIAQWESEKPEKPADYRYHREPLDIEIKSSRNNKYVNAHSYATKTPHQAIMRWILHYTDPGDIVLDLFAGTGMTAVAAQLCGNPETEFQIQVEKDNEKVNWGERKVIIGDLGIAPTFIARNLNTPDEKIAFNNEIDAIIQKIEKELGWMYKTKDRDGNLVDVVAILWSDIFICSNCSEEFTYWDAAVDLDAGVIASKIMCPICKGQNDKKNLLKSWVNEFDPILNSVISRVKSKPQTIIFDRGGKRYEKIPDDFDIELINSINNYKIPYYIPSLEIPSGFNTEQPKRSHGITHVHHFFTKRNLALLACGWSIATSERAKFLLTSLMYKSSVLCAPLMSNYFAEKNGNPRGGWIGKERSGTLYCPAIHSEVMLIPQISSRSKSVFIWADSNARPLITTQSATDIKIPDNTIDYIFTDPPFGANRMYSELNFLWEAWLGIRTSTKKEAIENSARAKTHQDYRRLLLSCFREYYRILKPGHWITVEFSNTKALVWNTLQTVLGEAGFVVAAVNGLDKKQGSIEAYTSAIAVTKDLVISAYKPNGGFEERFQEEAPTEKGVWDFIQTHLKYLPVIKKQGVDIIVVPERDPRILFDQVVAYYVRKGYDVPIDSQEFQLGLSQRFSERDGMFFLPEQVPEYDRKKMIGGGKPVQHSLFISDEASAINWLRNLLRDKPQTFQEINPQFMKELGGWSKNETGLELSTLLEQNFLRHDGNEKVPSQIHSHLSTFYKELRNLSKDNPDLIAKAKDRWYVPDPNKAGDLEKIREKSLLKEFGEYKQIKKKLKVFRLEAVRAGFKKAWQERDYESIVSVADKIPSKILEEDPKLLMWFDQAVTRMEDSEGGLA